MPITKLNDIDLYYEVEGEGDWLIFVHGGDSTHLSWWQQVYAFRDKYKCLTYDMRGLGQSTGEINYPESWKDLLALMDHLKIERAHLNGWSAGGWTVSTIAQKYPERVLSLTMTDTAFGFQTPALSKWSQDMLDKLAANQPIGPASTTDYYAGYDPKGRFLSAMMGRLNEDTRPVSVDQTRTAYAKSYQEWRDAKPGDYSKFNVPTLFVIGEVDGLTVPSLIRGTAKQVRGAQVAVLPRAGHGPPREQMDVYNAVLLDFLRSVDAKRGDSKHQRPKWSLVEYFHSLSAA